MTLRVRFSVRMQNIIMRTLSYENFRVLFKHYCCFLFLDVHNIRNHKGQGGVARRLRSLLHSETYPSEIAQSHRFCDRVQDAYTLRCCPQVHGIAHDTIDFVRGVITTEMNSGTDNPVSSNLHTIFSLYAHNLHWHFRLYLRIEARSFPLGISMENILQKHWIISPLGFTSWRQ